MDVQALVPGATANPRRGPTVPGASIISRTSSSYSGMTMNDTAGHILKMPKFASGIGAFRLADMASAKTWRVCAGSMTPSSHNRALA